MVSLYLTITNVVQFAVVNDVSSSVIILRRRVLHLLTKSKHEKMRVGMCTAFTRVNAGRRDLHCLDREDRRPIRHRD